MNIILNKQTQDEMIVIYKDILFFTWGPEGPRSPDFPGLPASPLKRQKMNSSLYDFDTYTL